MKSQEQLQTFYTNVLLPIIEPLESFRLENALKLKRHFYTALCCLPLISIGFFLHEPIVVLISIIPTIIFLGLAYQKLSELNKKLRHPFKNEVLLRTIGFLFDKYEYIPNQRIAKSVLIKSMLFPKIIIGVQGEDFMKFKIGDAIIMFCETKVLGPRDKIMFNGIFISSSFNKYFNSKTFVFSKNTSGFLLRIKRQLLNKMQKIDVENTEFKNEFIVVSGDQVEARYILSPSLMTRILDYKNKTGKELSISFIHNRLYCTVPKFKNLFEVPFLKPIDFECILNTIEPIVLYTDIVADLNLNLKIWSKL